MTSLNLSETQRLIWSPFRSCRAIQGKRRQNYLYYKCTTLLKFALSFFGTLCHVTNLTTQEFRAHDDYLALAWQLFANNPNSKNIAIDFTNCISIVEIKIWYTSTHGYTQDGSI